MSTDDIFVHPLYSGRVPISPHFNDLVVIQLKTPLKLGTKIGKIDMVDEYFVPKKGDKVKMLVSITRIGFIENLIFDILNALEIIFSFLGLF